MERSLRLISPLDRAFHLKKLDGLREAPPVELAYLAVRAHENSYKRGTILSRPGERVDSVHIVVDGRVRVRGGEHGDDVIGVEQVVGMLSLLARDDHGLDAVAEVDTRTLSLRADDLFDAFEDDFSVLYNLIRELAIETLHLRKRIPEGTYLAPAEDHPTPAADIDLVQRLLYMRRGRLLNDSMDAVMALALRTQTSRFKPGTKLWEIGAPSGFMYSILSGKVRCRTEDGTHFVCGPGYPLGNLESQCDAPRWYEAVTDTPVTVLQNDTDAFLDMLEQHFEMAMVFVAAMASGLIARRAEMREENSPE